MENNYVIERLMEKVPSNKWDTYYQMLIHIFLESGELNELEVDDYKWYVAMVPHRATGN